MYLFSYVALRYMYTFFIIITCILSKFLLYDFQVLIYNIYNQTVLPFNVLLSFQEIFLPTVVLYSMLYTWIYKRSDASSAHISSNILIVVLHSKCEEFWYSSIIFKRIFWIHCYLNCCAKFFFFFLHICTCICWNACMVTLMPFFKLLYKNFSVKLTIDIKVN